MSDTTELQGLINDAVANNQEHLILPAGKVWTVERAGSAPWCITIPPNVSNLQVHGNGNTIYTAPATPGSVRAVCVQGPGTAIDNLNLRGGQQDDADEHRCGFFVTAPGFRGRKLTATGFTGDGFDLYRGSDNVVLDSCTALYNGRNGVTLNWALCGVTLFDSEFRGNIAQQVDTEPGAGQMVHSVTIDSCWLQALNGDYALTMGGSSVSGTGQDFTVVNCQIDGAIYVVWGKNITIDRCYGTNDSAKPTVDIWRTSRDINVTRCNFVNNASRYAATVTSTGTGSSPQNVNFDGNIFTINNPGGSGIFLSGALSSRLSNNMILGSGAVTPGKGVGILVRSTSFVEVPSRIELERNQINALCDTGIRVVGNQMTDPSTGIKQYARIDRLRVEGNYFGNNASGQPLTTGMDLDDGTIVVQNFNVARNGFDPTVTTQVRRGPSNTEQQVP